jgi:filamentous hemagglutinin family protein
MISGHSNENLISNFFSLKKRIPFLFFRNLLIVFLIWLIGGWPTIVFALPSGGQIVSGDGTIVETSTTQLDINQNSSQLIATFQNFNTAANETVNVNQQYTSDTFLAKVLGTDPTLFLGKLNAKGQVFITNGSGVFFGPGSQIDVHGLVATTMDISSQDFLDRNYKFTQNLNNSLSSVINEGTISATSYVGLLAPAVENRGTIVTASLGSIDLASGTAATMDFTGDGLIQFEVTQAVSGTVLDKDGNELEDRVSNTGLLHADGGQIRMSAKDAGDVIRHVVNMEGMIKANSVVEKDGKVFLMGGDSGVVNVSGIIDASGDDAGEKGGTVQVTGEYVGLFDEAKVDVSGDAGGGEALIGGDYQGKNSEVQNAERTFIGEDAVIDASAGTTGDGGKVIVWADDVTRFYGSVYATGGNSGGDGGFAEVSGKGNLDFHANRVDLSAANGEDGTLLLDPLNITITTSADSNTAGYTAGSDDTEAFADDSGLTSNFDVTAGTGSFNGVTGTIELQATNDITISAAWNLFNSTGNSNVNVVLRAGNDININAAVTLDGTGTLTLEADGNGQNGVGDLNFGASGSITTGGGDVHITANDIDITSGSISAGTGTVTLLTSDDQQIGVGTGVTGMTITDAELDNISATNLMLGDGTEMVAFGTISNTSITGTITVNSAAQLSITSGTVNIANNLTVIATFVSQGAGALIVGGSASFTSVGNITLNNAGNQFTDLTLNTSNDITVVNSSTLTDLNITANTGTHSITSTGLTFDVDNTGGFRVNDVSQTGLNFSLTVSNTGIVLTDTAISVGAGNVALTSTVGSINEETSNGTANITNTGTVSLTAFTSIGTSGANNEVDIDTATDLTFNVNDDLYVRGGAQIISALDVTVDPSGAATYTLANFDAAQTFSMTTDGTDLTITDVSNTGAVNQTITAKTGNVTVTNFDSAGGAMALTATTGNIVLGDDAINAGGGTVAVTSTAGSITEASSNTTANITTTGTVTLTAGASIGTTGANNELDIASAGNFVFEVNDNLFIRGGTQTIGSLILTVDPSGAATYELNNFNAAQTFNMTTDGTDLTVVDVSNTGSVNNTITAKTGNVNVTNLDSLSNVAVTATAGNLVIGSGGIDFSRNNIVSLDASGTITGAGLTTVTITQGDKRFKTGTASIDTLNLSGGTLTVDGAVSVTIAATWNGGTIGGTGTLTTNSGVTTTMSGSVANATLSGTWENNGTINWSPIGGFDLTISGTLNNNSGANFNLQNANIAGDILGSGTVNNAGTMTENSAVSDTDFNPTFNNTGTVTVTQGNIRFAGTGTDTGSYTVASGATLTFFNTSGTRELQSASSVTGAGTVVFDGAGTHTAGGTYNVTGTTTINDGTNTFSATGVTGLGNLTVSGGANTIDGINLTSIGDIAVSGGTTTISTGNSFSFSNLNVTGGTLQGSDNLTVTSTATWNGGTIGGTGTLTTNSGVTTTMSGSVANATLSRTWDNNGTINWSPIGGLDFTISGTLNNNSGANFNLQNANIAGDILGSGTVNNAGTMTENSAVSDTDFNPTFNNTGTVTVTQGNLQLNGGERTLVITQLQVARR